MKLDSGQLHAFVTVVREGSFDAAARVLSLSAPAVSQRIKLLEERLGQVLIQRGTPCRPTHAGVELARHAEQLSLLEAETLRALGHPGGLGDDRGSAQRPQGSAIRLPVAVNADSLDSWFIDVFEALADSGIYLDVRVDDQDHSARMLREGTVAAALTAEPSAVQGCEVTPLGKMRYLALASPEFATRYFQHVTSVEDMLNAFSQAPMLQFNAKDGLQRRFMDAALTALADDTPERERKQGRIAPSTYFLPSSKGFMEAARRGLAWGMIPRIMAERYLENGEMLPICAGAQLDVPLYWQQWAMKSVTLARVAETVASLASQVLEPA